MTAGGYGFVAPDLDFPDAAGPENTVYCYPDLIAADVIFTKIKTGPDRTKFVDFQVIQAGNIDPSSVLEVLNFKGAVPPEDPVPVLLVAAENFDPADGTGFAKIGGGVPPRD